MLTSNLGWDDEVDAIDFESEVVEESTDDVGFLKRQAEACS